MKIKGTCKQEVVAYFKVNFPGGKLSKSRNQDRWFAGRISNPGPPYPVRHHVWKTLKKTTKNLWMVGDSAEVRSECVQNKNLAGGLHSQ
jgi:hypothetical protein